MNDLSLKKETFFKINKNLKKALPKYKNSFKFFKPLGIIG